MRAGLSFAPSAWVLQLYKEPRIHMPLLTAVIDSYKLVS